MQNESGLNPADTPATALVPPTGLQLPVVAPTANPALDAALAQRLALNGFPAHALGRLEALVLQLARIQATGPEHGFEKLLLDAPQAVVFAADHGIADEGVSAFAMETTRLRVLHMLAGRAPVNALADLHGFGLTVVDAGLASHLAPPEEAAKQVTLVTRKIGHGTRNMLLSPAMSVAQAVAALHAGMDVVRHLPGHVLALGDVGVGSTSSAALLLWRLCGVPLTEACAHPHAPEDGPNSRLQQNKLEKLQAVALRHRKAVAPLDALAAMGGFEIAMMAGAMLQAASERRVVLVDGFVACAAALVARGLCPAVADYWVFGHRSAQPGHRLALAQLQAQPLLDMDLHTGQAAGALLAWPLLQAAQSLLKN